MKTYQQTTVCVVFSPHICFKPQTTCVYVVRGGVHLVPGPQPEQENAQMNKYNEKIEK